MSYKMARVSHLSSVKLALMAERIRAENDGVRYIQAEPIAIIGMGCRFPGDADNPAAYWKMLKDGTDAICEVPKDRWDVDAYYDPDPNVPGKMSVKLGGFLKQIDQFDAAYFGIPPREARLMDPQQRLALEVSFEALEDAGLVHDELSGSKMGVFIASYHNDYFHLAYADYDRIEAYNSTGAAHSIVANRISYLLNLHGPSLAVDTACSSSLVSLHLACQSLRNGECDLALAGGVSLMASPIVTISLSKWGLMSPDGRCKTFDASADGFVRGEGCGILVLKRFSDALRDGDRIHALIRGSAVNQDGRTNVLTAPNGLAQQEVIRQALENAGLDSDAVTYIETHGTGTSLGDPIEVEALREVYGQRSDGSVCVLGAVKTNIGHLEAAAGVAGVIKTVLCLKHRAIPKNLHFKKLNPHIQLDGVPLVLANELMSWETGNKRRFAGVSSFGFGGTNSHLILEEAINTPAESHSVKRRFDLLPISAHTPEALKLLAEGYQALLETVEPDSLTDLVYTASRKRNHQDYRLAIVGRSKDELIARLGSFVQKGMEAGKEAAYPGIRYGHRQPGRRPRLAMVFSGQGPQWWGMGRSLFEEQPVYRQVIEQCDAGLKKYADWSLLTELLADEAHSRLDQTAIAQPALFALQAALAALWISWGIKPDAVVGHSLGEVTAAYVAGVLSLEDAIRVVYNRGRLMQQATGLGQMAATGLSQLEAEQVVGRYRGKLSLAAINSPISTVLSGEVEALEEVLADLQQREVFNRKLPVNYAFHSEQMAPFQEALTKELVGILPRPAILPIYSTVTGSALSGEEFDANYWGRNIRQPVRFADAIYHLAKNGHDIFLELSPDPVLGRMVQQCLDAIPASGTILPSLRKNQDDQLIMLQGLGELYCQGIPIRWREIYPSGNLVETPPIPWQRKRFWLEPKPSRSTERKALEESLPAQGTLLGNRLISPALREIVFQSYLGPTGFSFLRDHRVFNRLLFPGTGYIEIGLQSAKAIFGEPPYCIENLILKEAMVWEDSESLSVQTILSHSNASDSYSFEIVSLAKDGQTWKQHASGQCSRGVVQSGRLYPALETIKERCSTVLEPAELYHKMQQRGIEFGSTFRGVSQLFLGVGEALCRVDLKDHLLQAVEGYQFHPAFLDACLQPFSVLFPEQTDDAFLPVGFDRLYFHGVPGQWVWSYVELDRSVHEGEQTKDKQELLIGKATVFNGDGRLVAEIEGLRLKRARLEDIERVLRKSADKKPPTEYLDDRFYLISWQQKALGATAASVAGMTDSWIILADKKGLGKELVARLRKQGGACTAVFAGDQYARLARDEYQVNPLCPADFERLIEEVKADRSDRPGLWRIAHFWSLDCPGPDELGPEASGVDWLDRSQGLSCGSLIHLLQSLNKAIELNRIALLLVTRGSQAVIEGEKLTVEQAPVWGLVNTFALEFPEIRWLRVDLDPAMPVSGDPEEQNLHALSSEWISNAINQNTGFSDDQIAYRSGQRYVARLIHLPADHGAGSQSNIELHPQRLEISERGLLDNLSYQPVRRRAPGPGEVEVRVGATGLNFRDVLNALGMYPGDPGPLGDEFAGEITAVGEGVSHLQVGDRVMGLAPASFSTFVTAQAKLVVHLPPDLSFEQAATIPIAFLTAYFALHHLGKVKAGDRVLIHAAAGGVGLAAVQLALRAGAVIFGTAGNPEKRQFLKDIGVHHVMDSRSLDFAKEILQITQGEGIDFVLNSLAGEFIPTSVSVLKANGCFVEIGKTDIWSEEQVHEVKPGVSYHAFFLGDLMRSNADLIQEALIELTSAIQDKDLKLLPFKVFYPGEVKDAFRYMQQARHIGKIVISQALKSDQSPGKIRSDRTYLIAGGTGGLGLATARWLVEQGARHLAIVARRPAPEAVGQVLDELRQRGADIAIIQADLAKQEDVARLFRVIEENMPPLQGVIHAAGINADSVVIQQSWNHFRQVMGAKVLGTWYLHDLTQQQKIDFFVMFSSAAAVLGSHGQANYAAANAFQDAMAHYRRANGMMALSVNWGAWEQVGMVMALREQDQARLSRQGIGLISPAKGLDALQKLLFEQRRYPQVMVLPIDWSKYLEIYGSRRWLAFFSGLLGEGQVLSEDKEATKKARLTLRQELEQAPTSRKRQVIIGYLKDQARFVLGLDEAYPLDIQQPLRDLGMDSLMAVELRNSLRNALGVHLPATLWFDYPTIETVTDYLLKLVLPVAKEGAGETVQANKSIDSSVEATYRDLELLSEDEAEALLLMELEKTKKKDLHNG